MQEYRDFSKFKSRDWFKFFKDYSIDLEIINKMIEMKMDLGLISGVILEQYYNLFDHNILIECLSNIFLYCDINSKTYIHMPRYVYEHYDKFIRSVQINNLSKKNMTKYNYGDWILFFKTKKLNEKFIDVIYEKYNFIDMGIIGCVLCECKFDIPDKMNKKIIEDIAHSEQVNKKVRDHYISIMNYKNIL